ncbi:hypothetical protein SBA7_120044 [Candidatus Sulfotelmatobacter sp. SbA7]|nr:hypothetical protein SBA7_120044 [Candidatus Sulfotelmatobacter sp. SbA7]
MGDGSHGGDGAASADGGTGRNQKCRPALDLEQRCQRHTGEHGEADAKQGVEKSAAADADDFMQVHAETQADHRGLQQKAGKLSGTGAVGMDKPEAGKPQTESQTQGKSNRGRGESTRSCGQAEEEDDFLYHSGLMGAGPGDSAGATPALCCGALIGIHGQLLTVVNLKDGHQFRKVQQVAYALREVGQFDATAAVLRSGVKGDQGAEAAAIHESDAGQVEDQAFFFNDQFLDGVAKIGGFFPENEASGTIHDHDGIDDSSTYLELHAGPPRSQKTN